MVFPIAGGNKSKGYDVENSLRFDDGSSAYLNRTQTAGNRRTFTWSAWIKRGVIGTRQTLWSAGNDGNDESFLRFDASDYISYKESTGNSPEFLFDTNQVFRDPSAWYHIVFAVDTTQSSQENRIKLYVNGSQVTSYQNTNYPSQNYDTRWNNNSQVTYLGMNVPDYRDYYDGYMTEVNFIDGSQLTPTSFGEFDDNGVWIPKKYTGSYGTNGYFLEFQQTGTSQNSSGIGADTSGNDNHFAVSGIAATDVTEDTCTNNFATMNFLDNFYSEFTFSEGNCKFLTDGADTAYNTATIGNLKQGKWYFEIKYTDPSHSNSGGDAGDYFGEIGVIGQKLADTNSSLYPSSQEHNFAYSANNGRIKSNNSAGTVHGSQISNDGQIIGFLLDLDNNRVTTHKDGQYADGSGNHDESFDNAAFVSITAPASTPLGGYFIGFGESKGSTGSGSQNTGTYEINFGNPSFAISSSNADADGHGNFEYAVPSGYFALCTKNLAEYG